MRAVSSLLLLLHAARLPGGAASSFGRRGGVSPRALAGRRVGARDVDALVHLRGGQQTPPDSTPSYHGNYVAQAGEEPKAAATATSSAAATTAAAVVAPAPAVVPAPAPPILASATSANSKLSNLQERTGPAVLMLAATYLLIKFTGKKGMVGLVYAMQLGLYHESTSVVEDHQKKGGTEVEEVPSFPVQKWWWFATAMVFAGRDLLEEHTSLHMDQLNLLTFGMTSASLVGAVVQLAMVSSANAENVYRNYLSKVALCHFSLMFLVGQSSFWIRTIRDYGIMWVLFPALLVVVNDTMAYVFGVLLGKHKLLPRLSPKKTVEGFIGAGLSTLAVAAPLLRKMAGADGVVDLKKHALLLALYVSLVSPFGGFLASAVKRAHGAKDFGALIPGHGGVVDRFDCQVVTAPFVYLYLKNFLAVATDAGAE